MAKKTEIIYTNKYIDLSREELILGVSQMMTEERLEHVLRVEEKALELAEIYQGDSEKVSIAALLHDIAKDQVNEEMRDIIISENLNLDLLQYGSAIWHGPVGAILAKREFQLKDEDILESITYHTVGAREMSLTTKIIFVADYIEANRNFPLVEKARELAKKSLEETIIFKLKETIKYLIDLEEKVYPKTIESYNAWIDK